MMNSKRICIVSAQYLPHVGGVENYVASFSKELLSRGYSVTIITSQIKGLSKYENHENIEIFRLPTWQFINGRFPVTYPSFKRHRLLKQLKQRKFDAMLVNVRFYFLSLLAVKLAKRWKCPCVLLDHGSGHLTMQGKLKTRLGEWFEHWITNREKKYNPQFACVSKASAEWIRHFGIETNIILYNAIFTEEFEAMKKANIRDFRKEFSIPQNDIVIAFIGRLTEGKGVLELKSAVEKIRESRHDVWLLIAGDGNLKSQIQTEVNSAIRCLGSISKAEVVSLHLQSDIFCFPSTYPEGFSTAVLEAAICENFIIATNKGDTKAIVKDRTYGIILDSNSPDVLCQSIQSVLDDAEYRHQASHLCYKEVTRNFTWNKTVDRFLTIIE